MRRWLLCWMSVAAGCGQPQKRKRLAGAGKRWWPKLPACRVVRSSEGNESWRKGLTGPYPARRVSGHLEEGASH
jgi:hypothetical protein